MSHTPGPWHVQPGAVAVPEQGRTIVINHQTEEDGWWQVRSDAAPGDLQADLRLIAAAPGLLLAVERLRAVEEAAKEVAAAYHENSAGKDGRDDYCHGCGNDWPCATALLRNALNATTTGDSLRTERQWNAELVEAAQHLLDALYRERGYGRGHLSPLEEERLLRDALTNHQSTTSQGGSR